MNQKERTKLGLLLVMTFVMALLDVVGVASIMPFIAVLANPQHIQNNLILNTIYTKFEFVSLQEFMFVLGGLVFFLLIASLVFKAFVTYAHLRFTLLQEFNIGKRLVEGYLYQSYSWFLGRHSADLGKNILSEVEKVINQAILPMMTLITQGAIALALLILLIVVDPQLAFIVGIALTITYISIFKVTRAFLAQAGKDCMRANQNRFTVISEAFSASKEIKVGGLERVYISRFSSPAQIYARYLAFSEIISRLPRFALEAISFGGILLMTLYLMTQSGDFKNIVPTIALYAFAGYRLIPALHQIYSATTKLRFSGATLDGLHAELIGLKAINHNENLAEGLFKVEQAIKLTNIVYFYPNSNYAAIKDINLCIPARSKVAIVGSTGSGKTTMVDLILGLLEPQQGFLEVDGQVIGEHNRRKWQRSIGYVPQQIYLADDTVAANIAFGVDEKDINQNAVECAAKIANLHDFVINNLTDKYQTTIGERGVRLSGGQRQRIGIARALYHNPQVLVLDEATSALDNLTEQAVMDAVNNLGNEVTVILIAHRLSTVKNCDSIFVLDMGRLIAQGSYDELNSSNITFQKMTGRIT